MNTLDAVLALVSSLPNPGNPSFITLCATIGLFVGSLIDRARRRRHDDRDTPAEKDGFLLGFGIGFACWTLVVAIDRL